MKAIIEFHKDEGYKEWDLLPRITVLDYPDGKGCALGFLIYGCFIVWLKKDKE